MTNMCQSTKDIKKKQTYYYSNADAISLFKFLIDYNKEKVDIDVISSNTGVVLFQYTMGNIHYMDGEFAKSLF